MYMAVGGNPLDLCCHLALDLLGCLNATTVAAGSTDLPFEEPPWSGSTLWPAVYLFVMQHMPIALH